MQWLSQSDYSICISMLVEFYLTFLALSLLQLTGSFSIFVTVFKSKNDLNIMHYRTEHKTGSMDNAIQEFSLA